MKAHLMKRKSQINFEQFSDAKTQWPQNQLFSDVAMIYTSIQVEEYIILNLSLNGENKIVHTHFFNH